MAAEQTNAADDRRDGGDRGFDANEIVTGDLFEVLPEWPSESVHAVVTDPPQDLKMDEWDEFEDDRAYMEWCRDWAEEVLRVLKPGGHLLASGADKTYGLLETGIRFAGFEILPMHGWLHAEGYPKGQNVSEEIAWPQSDPAMYRFYDDWNTRLKPALEPSVVARKPSEGTAAETLREHGTGAFNVADSLVPSDGSHKRQHQPSNTDRAVYGDHSGFDPANRDGRYPSNVVCSEEGAEALDRQVGGGQTATLSGDEAESEEGPSEDFHVLDGDDGVARVKYCGKASKEDRTLGGRVENYHQTVKPVELMEHYVRLVSAPGQTVLDPFAGSGTTGRAVLNLNVGEGAPRGFVGVERDPRAADIARLRCGFPPENPERVLADDGQPSLGRFSGL